MRNTYNGFRNSILSSMDIEVDPSQSYRKINTCEVIDNRIYFYSEIEREDILNLNKSIRECSNSLIVRSINEEINDQKIFLHINSQGGDVFAGLSAMDEILKCKTPVYTIVDGCAASSATFLSVVGKKRFIHEHALILIHQLSSEFWGKYSEFQDAKDNLDKLMNIIGNIYAQYTKLNGDKLNELLKHDLWLDASEAVKYGLADEII